MTTFKNNAKYAELLLTYLDVAYRFDTPLEIPEVLRVFAWRFKGGTLARAAQGTRLVPETSGDFYPDGLSSDIADEWPSGIQAKALALLLSRRAADRRIRNRAVLARLSTYQALTSSYGLGAVPKKVYSGMRAIYHIFRLVWDWCKGQRVDQSWESLHTYIKDMALAGSGVSRMHVPTVNENRATFQQMLEDTRAVGLFSAISQVKSIIRQINGPDARNLARWAGNDEKRRWEETATMERGWKCRLSDQGMHTRHLKSTLGPCSLRVSQGLVFLGTGEVRYAMGKSDVERLHQLMMSSLSALVGVCAQACVGTLNQRRKAREAVYVAEENICRIVRSSQLVPLGDEVLVCKGYRRAYTAHLGYMAGPLCTGETAILVQEAIDTAPPGVLDIEGFLADAKTLDAASSLNSCKMFKICPAPDVSPGAAMMDRIKQIGDGNTVDKETIAAFETELRSQILRAYIRHKKGRLNLRRAFERPTWWGDYLKGEFDKVPSAEIHTYMAWEGDAEMPEVSAYDPANWKDSGLGADTIAESTNDSGLGHKANMITRLIFDDECPMPGRKVLNEDHVIKFFVKAEGHKDPARGIFSANLTDRQAQSWMERAVDQVARHHPSYMIGQSVDVKESRVMELTARNGRTGWIALYYSFDISGWSAKMPAEPQRISHSIWASLYKDSVFSKAAQINEDAHIYLNLDGYMGWYRNTHSNLEGFNGKEMTMVLVALLSLSVRIWRTTCVTMGLLTDIEASMTAALLFAYIDDGLSRIDLPARIAVPAFTLYKNTVIETFKNCGFSIEVSKCFPSDRFAIFLNEVYLAGRHVVHGVRAAMAISAEPTERHTTLTERVSTVATGCRGAVMAGLSPMSGVLLMAFHTYLHLLEWVDERDPVVLAAWCYCPKSWGGLGMPNMLQMYTSGSGSAFEEGVATMQIYARMNPSVKTLYLNMCKIDLKKRDSVGVLTAPLSGRIDDGYMVDSRVAVYIRRALQEKIMDGELSRYAMRLLTYADEKHFRAFADAVIPLGEKDVIQEQMLDNVAASHPHSVFSAFARRLEKSMTVLAIVGRQKFVEMLETNRVDAATSVSIFRGKFAS